MQYQPARHSGSLGDRHQVADAIQQFIHSHHLRFRIIVLLRDLQAFDCKRAETKSARLAVCIERVVWSILNTRFRNEDRIACDLIPLHPVFEVGPIDIGRVEIDAGCARTPYLKKIRVRSPAGILAGPLLRRWKLRIHVHRKRIFLLPCLHDRFDVTRIIPSHEDFAGHIVKHLGPSPPVLVEVGRKFRRELSAFCCERAHQPLRHRPAKDLVRLGRAVPARPEITDFILYLHHQHGLLLGILLANVAHHSGERAAVTPARLRR